MGEYKGSGFDYVRKRLRQRGLSEEAVLARLSLADAQLFRAITPLTWVPVDAAGRIMAAACELLEPANPKAVFEVGRGMASDHVGGMYRLLLRFVTIPTVIERAAKLWSTYHSAGQATASRVPFLNDGQLVVTAYPHLDPTIRESVTGYIQGIVELTGAKNVEVLRDDSNPGAWRWHIRWT